MQVESHSMAPGTQNAFIEDCDGYLGDKLPNETLFVSLDYARSSG